MITVLIIVLVLSIIGNIILGIGLRNVFKQNDFWEDKYKLTQILLEQMLATMRDIDIRGSFEADDEVGSAFDGLKETIKEYKKRI